ncbi:hypothetical protein TNCV_4860541 [Trichonephila clavipes]|nr:hypothetical protein TNCV_4860541 [Trichonephila clavipes]
MSIAQLHESEFQGRKDSKPVFVRKVEKDSVRSRDVHIEIVKRKLMKEGSRQLWRLGRILEIHKGRDDKEWDESGASVINVQHLTSILSGCCVVVVSNPLGAGKQHQVHLTFPRNSLTHQVLLFIQLSQENAPAVQKMSRRSKERAGTEVGKPIDENSACVEVGKPIDENPACVEVGTNSV